MLDFMDVTASSSSSSIFMAVHHRQSLVTVMTPMDAPKYRVSSLMASTMGLQQQLAYTGVEKVSFNKSKKPKVDGEFSPQCAECRNSNKAQ